MAFSCSSRPSLSSSPADAKHPRLCPSSPLGEKIYFPRFALSLQCRRKSLWSLPQTNNLVVWDPQVSHAGLYRISWAQKCCEFGFFSVLPLTSVPSQLHNGGILLWLHIVNLDTFFSFMIILVGANMICCLSANIFHLLADRYILYVIYEGNCNGKKQKRHN